MSKPVTGTPYDDVFRTLLDDCTSLIIPVVNEVFGEHFTGDEQVVFQKNEHFLSRQDGDTKEKITDSCFTIKGEEIRKKYHMECQSTSDTTIMVRMFEYDSQGALDDCENAGNKLIVTFPHSAVIFLRHTRNTPDQITMEISTPGGSISHAIPVLKTQQYTIDELFDKNLLFLIPFHIFSYEKEFPDYENDSETLLELQEGYSEIMKRLEELCAEGRISTFEKCALIDMSKKVVENLAVKYANVTKGVTSVMGGKVLEYEAKTILREGIQEGIQEGIRQVIQQGEKNTCIALVKDGVLKISDAAKRLGITEEEFQKYL